MLFRMPGAAALFSPVDRPQPCKKARNQIGSGPFFSLAQYMPPFETHRIGALYKNLWNSTFPCISRIPAIFKKIIPHANPRNSA
jgi:hypothetical protein